MNEKWILAALLLAATAQAESVVKYTWTVESGRGESVQVVYAGAPGMVTMQQDPGGQTMGEFIVLADRLIMNDDRRQSSMVLDPANMPQIPGFGGAGGAGGDAIAQALAQARQQIQDAPPEARQALEGLFGSGGLPGPAGQTPPAPAQFSPTGNSGTTDGMDWEEYEITIAGDAATYRLVDWSEVESADIVAGHYRNMAETFAKFMESTGLGRLLQGMDTMPREMVAFMIENRRFPIYIEQAGQIQRLTGVERDELDSSRFGARYPVENPFAQ